MYAKDLQTYVLLKLNNQLLHKHFHTKQISVESLPWRQSFSEPTVIDLESN